MQSPLGFSSAPLSPQDDTEKAVDEAFRSPSPSDSSLLITLEPEPSVDSMLDLGGCLVEVQQMPPPMMPTKLRITSSITEELQTRSPQSDVGHRQLLHKAEPQVSPRPELGHLEQPREAEQQHPAGDLETLVSVEQDFPGSTHEQPVADHLGNPSQLVPVGNPVPLA